MPKPRIQVSLNAEEELEWLHVKRDELWSEIFESGKALKADFDNAAADYGVG